MKRRKFATAVAFGAALLVAALAAASVSAATSSTQTVRNNVKLGAKPQAVKKAGTGQFKAVQGTKPKFINSPTPDNANAILKHDRRIPGKLGPKGSVGTNGAAGLSRAAASFIPQAHSLPITHQNAVASAKGLNAFDQDSPAGTSTHRRTRHWPRATATCSRP